MVYLNPDGSADITCSELHCDREHRIECAVDKQEARRQAKALGWVRRRRNYGLRAHYADLCPGCAKAEFARTGGLR
jgi:hypothetical protein